MHAALRSKQILQLIAQHLGSDTNENGETYNREDLLSFACVKKDWTIRGLDVLWRVVFTPRRLLGIWVKRRVLRITVKRKGIEYVSKFLCFMAARVL
jgi:hypothetical protein